LAGIGYGKGAYGSWYDPEPEEVPVVEVLLGEEEVEEDIVEVVIVRVEAGML
jgi:hypothetical protein